tara:strand:- start:237 stop:443 length:207 start_codon:yes stop_codon:yes gene_type:complete
MQITIIYKGAILEVSGELSEPQAGDHYTPGLLADFETYEVLAGGVNITDLLDENQLLEIDLTVLENIN